MILFEQLIVQLLDFDYIGGFFLDEILHKNIIQDFKFDWSAYNRSLKGICYHPRFLENFEDIKRSSNMIS